MTALCCSVEVLGLRSTGSLPYAGRNEAGIVARHACKCTVRDTACKSMTCRKVYAPFDADKGESRASQDDRA